MRRLTTKVSYSIHTYQFYEVRRGEVMSEVSPAQCPVQRECKAAPPVEHSTSAVVKYTEESAPMRLGDAVQYFGLRVTMVFLVSEGAYNAKECKAVAMGKDRQSSLI